MKAFLSFMSLSVLIASSSLSASAAIRSEGEEKEVIVGIADAFIPGGFSSESDAYVVVNGLFQNGCYRWNRAEVKHGVEAKVHEVRSVASVSQGMCIMVMVPFTKEVTLGKLEAGEHKIRFVNGDGTYMEKTLQIEE